MLIVAHGDRGGSGDNRLVNTLAANLRRSDRFVAVGAGYLRGEQPFEEVAVELLNSVASCRLRVLPLLMSDSYYTRQAIPQRLGLGIPDMAQIIIDPPIGLHPRLPNFIAAESAAALERSGIEPANARLLLVAHGSTKSTASADATRRVAGMVALTKKFAAVEVAFLEEPPFLSDQLRNLSGPLCVFGLFVGEGLHGGEDLPRAVADNVRPGLILAPPLADCEGMIDLIAASF